MEKAIFGAGCFWHVEEAFRTLKGVKKTTVGYSGGKLKNPSYEDLRGKGVGHVEVCLVDFDPKIITYVDLLKVFWKIHDPTQGERQGFDIGTQYKSVIFYFNDKQKKQAEQSLKDKQKELKKTITTEIRKAEKFYKAEEYHQKYEVKHGGVCGI